MKIVSKPNESKEKEPKTPLEIATFCMAIIGCSLGLFNTVWNVWINHLTYSDNVLVDVIGSGFDPSTGSSTISVDVINNGRSPVSLRSVSIVDKRNEPNAEARELFSMSQDDRVASATYATLLPASGVAHFTSQELSEDMLKITCNNTNGNVMVQVLLNDGRILYAPVNLESILADVRKLYGH